MPVTNYYTVDGEIIGEATGGVRADYMVDALGSVTGTVDQSAQVLNTYRYKPYGALLAKTGAGADPKRQWVGSLGYRATGRRQSESYVRARHYGTSSGLWTSHDRWWPRLPALGYGLGNPCVFVDPTGTLPYFTSDSGCSSGFQAGIGKCCQPFQDKLGNRKGALDAVRQIAGCLDEKGFRGLPAELFLDQALENWRDLCAGGASGGVCINCNWGLDRRPYPPQCDPCKEPSAAITVIPRQSAPIVPGDSGCFKGTRDLARDECLPLLEQSQCDCLVVFCEKNKDYKDKGTLACDILFHEMVHCGGVSGPRHHADPDDSKHKQDIIWAISCCLCEALNGQGNSQCRNCNPWRVVP